MVFTLPALSILPTLVELASLLNAVPAFQAQATIVSLLAFISVLLPIDQPSELKDDT